VDSKGEIKVDQGPTPEPKRPWPVLATAVLIALGVGALVVLTNFQGSGAIAPEETLPDVGPDPLETAVRVVEEFAAAWNVGEVTTAESLISDDWDTVVLPGFQDPWFHSGEGRKSLSDGIAFLSPLTRLSLGSCQSEFAPSDSAATAVVHCDEADFVGNYLDAVWTNAWRDLQPGLALIKDERTPGMSFGVREDRIVSIDIEVGVFAPQAYCIWAEQTHPEAASLFDLHCHPRPAGLEAPAHAELAEAFMAAGAPLPSYQLAEARLAASYVDRFVELHNLVDTATVGAWLSTSVSAGDLPGFPGAANEPQLSDYLPWSARLLELATGECTIEIDVGVTIVTCPEMSVAGPLVSEPLRQPTRFVIASNRRGSPVARAYGRILAVEPLGDEMVPIEEICLRLQGSSASASAFADGCNPVYSAEGAEALTAALEL
jgi:hypothetical protein